MRIEKDALGAVEIPDDVAWGPQTERSRHNFPTGPLMPAEVIRALLTIKAAAATVNMNHGLDKPVGRAIITAADHLQALPDDQLMADFPLHVYQTGSGTQTNMNVNEVLTHLASSALGRPVLPNDDVNRGQSSNDTFPTALHMAAYPAVTKVCQSAEAMIATLKEKETAYANVVKLGRTHLQDATPLTFGQEVSGWRATLEGDVATLRQLQPQLLTLALGGTAVGTGLNTTSQQTAAMVAQIAKLTGLPFKEMPNKFHGLAFHSELTAIHGALKTLAADLMKIANDIRFLASGPRGGYGELTIPANEPGSSIMPGKVNPTQAEALTMIATRVMGNDTTIAVAESQGNFELNVYKPVIGATVLESCTLLAGGITQLDRLLLQGLTVNQGRMRDLVDRSLMLVTALSPHIGYAQAAKLAQTAQKNGQSLREAAIASGAVTAEQYDAWVDPLKMTNQAQK
ncbi:class II fumarate hydratase [Lacticaseibacillus camelliae]|uniref:Fumarate hydratase class II n=1 Tax=Lacticaseibacillus camelliae DSM 22697 = JCM 13995 TaxID=1423730 RepID=A0A0R2F2B3_9LACO|nr:class II fumarate hydratase [Lacticaseibacillus camelliae]KRN18637.1 fumarate hydratase [Lacticaseibacillus camelliae DSM 22697 = JCM 13995]